ncbi:MAG: dihydroorotate dehydrogenase electron transfer subunit [Clostridia bacterium]|jgi:dihydroorotate dehydrogenase electron transfer subunit|nr:dihydroorotate dehydrogenase electron transfer subunit [Clostridia bacterium]MCI1999504.1 dihydroorotate dehydrogenase electron transfer subunit [Clostridia bacterium]MCI2014117.1 dihydroorotate dehydrogenase electron transfer subunit [Clostridia bacterium]
MQKIIEMAEILENEEIQDSIFRMTLSLPEISRMAVSGQFINIYTGLGENILPRPISINEIDAIEGNIIVTYQVVGKGTDFFSKCPVGCELKVVGPLGNGFDLSKKYEKNIIVGGGIGIPPLVELCKHIEGRKFVFLGAKSKPIYEDDFRNLGAEVFICSDDGNTGMKGNVVELLNDIQPEGDMLFSCGPKIMLKYVSKWAAENNIPAQISLEERMACGIGACVGCTVKIQKKGDSDWQNLKVCKDGPVFMSDEVIWDD